MRVVNETGLKLTSKVPVLQGVILCIFVLIVNSKIRKSSSEMKRGLLIALLFSTTLVSAQWRWDFGGQMGVSNYLGDIGGKDKDRRDFIADMKLSKTRWNFGGFARYKWLPKISFKAGIEYLRIEGNDALSTNLGRMFRNFNFRNDIYDLSVTAEYFFYENNDLGGTYRYRHNFRCYVFAGGGAFYSNPKTFYRGEWVALQPYATEGVTYKKFNISIPMGIGLYFTINKMHRLGFEMNYRKTFTDYLDDISGNYPKDPGNDYERGLVLRTLEIDPTLASEYPGVYNSHSWGQKRGDKSNNDSYLTMAFSYSYVLRGKSSFYRNKNTSFFTKKYRRGRKIRAKF